MDKLKKRNKAVTRNSGMSPKLNRKGWAFVLPAFILILIFVFYPMVQSFLLSLKTGMGSNLTFTGLDNYKRLLTDETFKKALFNTVLYLIIQVPIMIILALAISSMLNNKKLKFRGFFRTAIFLPCVTSLVAYSIIFKSLFATDGIINSILMNIHLVSEPIQWLTNPIAAKVLIIIAITWRWTGYNMVFYLAGLQNIDYSVYEASYIDGATPFKQFIKITIPLLKPTILMTAIMSTSGTLQLFDESMNLTAGGPGKSTMTLAHYIYNISFVETPKFNYAAALSVCILIMVAILSAIQMKVGDKRD